MKHPMLTDRRLGLAALFLIVSLGFAFYRDSSFLVWNDGPEVMGPDLAAWQEHLEEWRWRREGLAANPLRTMRDVIGENFGVVQTLGYRPLCDLIFQVTCWYSGESLTTSFLHLTAAGTVYGTLAVCLFLVARRFVQSAWAACFAVLLVLASPPLAATSWVYRIGIQAVVPLLICLGLLCYWQVVEGRRRYLAMVGLCLLLIVAPWYREILFVLPVLIGFLEWERCRRPTFLLYCAVAGFLHALFPTALLKFFVYPELPLRSMFALSGSVPAALSSGGMRWHAANAFVPLLPPMLWTVALIGSCVEAWFELRIPVGVTEAPRHRLVFLFRAAGPVAGLVLAVIVWSVSSSHACLIICLTIPLMAIQTRQAALGVWFLLLFLPLLRVYTEHIHFLYAVVPAAIVFAKAMESLWVRIRALAAPCARVRYALTASVLLAAADQSMNLVGAYCSNHAMYSGMQQVAERLQRDIPKDSCVVCNVLHGWEVLVHSDYHFRVLRCGSCARGARVWVNDDYATASNALGKALKRR